MITRRDLFAGTSAAAVSSLLPEPQIYLWWFLEPCPFRRWERLSEIRSGLGKEQRELRAKYWKAMMITWGTYCQGPCQRCRGRTADEAAS